MNIRIRDLIIEPSIQKEESPYGLIYKVTNIINHKVYIGQTVQLLIKRIYRHRCLNDVRCKHLNSAMKKYGKDNFYYQIIGYANNQENLNKLEDLEIVNHDSINNGYNLVYKSEGSGKISPERSKRRSEIFTKICGVKVCKFDKNLKYIETYDSATKAGESVNKKGSQITACCRQQRNFIDNYIFVYLGDKYNIELLKSKFTRNVTDPLVHSNEYDISKYKRYKYFWKYNN